MPRQVFKFGLIEPNMPSGKTSLNYGNLSPLPIKLAILQFSTLEATNID